MLATLAIAALVGVTGVPAPAPSPLRHLVYTFTWGTSNSTEVHVSGLSNGSPVSAYTPNQVGNPTGISSFDASNSDKGSITVDVLREQPNDHGLVVTVSERAQDTRSANAATCVVFGNTDVVCDPSAKINYEELTLLRRRELRRSRRDRRKATLESRRKQRHVFRFGRLHDR